MMKIETIVILILMLFPAISYSTSLKLYEKGHLAGRLGFVAITIDAYYEICYSKGMRTDNHLKGINKLLKNKWDFTFSEISPDLGDLRKEAHNLVNKVAQKTGGCNTAGMEEWYRKSQDIHDNNLRKFHSAQ